MSMESNFNLEKINSNLNKTYTPLNIEEENNDDSTSIFEIVKDDNEKSIYELPYETLPYLIGDSIDDSTYETLPYLIGDIPNENNSDGTISIDDIMPNVEDIPDIQNSTPVETDTELEEKINELYDIINNLEDETVEIDGTTYNVEYKYDHDGNIVSRTLHTEDGGAGIQISSDGTVKICDFDSDGNISEIHGWQISDKELLNIFERDLLSIPYSAATAEGLGGNDLYVSGLADLNDEQWSKIEKFMDFADSGRVDLQVLAKIATLSDEDIERAYNMMLEDSSATVHSVYYEIYFEQLENE